MSLRTTGVAKRRLNLSSRCVSTYCEPPKTPGIAWVVLVLKLAVLGRLVDVLLAKKGDGWWCRNCSGTPECADSDLVGLGAAEVLAIAKPRPVPPPSTRIPFSLLPPLLSLR